MTWDIRLISLYYWVCANFCSEVAQEAERHQRNASSAVLAFTDQEAITVYLFGIMRKYKEVKDIHQYAKDHLLDWFPDLPSYQKFNERLNRLNQVFALLAARAGEELALPDWLDQSPVKDAVVDSMPIIMAIRGRADSAKVAREIANKGKCASKDIYYHGLKLHHLGFCIPNQLPQPQCLLLSAASENDNTVFKEQIAPKFRNLNVFSDRIYHDETAMPDLEQQFNISVFPCQKRKKGQAVLHADQKLFSSAVSRIKQPVESFFNWINEKTGIQIASKVRSTKGLLKHVFAKIAAAMLILAGF